MLIICNACFNRVIALNATYSDSSIEVASSPNAFIGDP